MAVFAETHDLAKVVDAEGGAVIATRQPPDLLQWATLQKEPAMAAVATTPGAPHDLVAVVRRAHDLARSHG